MDKGINKQYDDFLAKLRVKYLEMDSLYMDGLVEELPIKGVFDTMKFLSVIGWFNKKEKERYETGQLYLII